MCIPPFFLHPPYHYPAVLGGLRGERVEGKSKKLGWDEKGKKRIDDDVVVVGRSE